MYKKVCEQCQKDFVSKFQQNKKCMDCKRVQPVVKEPKYNKYFSIEHCNMLLDDAQVVDVRDGKSYIK